MSDAHAVFAISWNVAEYDGRHKHWTRPKKMFEAAGREAGLILAQEASGRFKPVAIENGFKLLGGNNLLTAYDPKVLTPIGKSKRGAMDCPNSRRTIYLIQAFKHRSSGVTIGTLNIHGAHPKGEVKRSHAKDIERLVEKVRKGVDILVTGGDFNEASQKIDAKVLGAVVAHHWVDRLSARGHARLKSLKAKALDKFGSDHCAIGLTIKFTNGAEGLIGVSQSGRDKGTYKAKHISTESGPSKREGTWRNEHDGFVPVHLFISGSAQTVNAKCEHHGRNLRLSFNSDGVNATVFVNPGEDLIGEFQSEHEKGTCKAKHVSTDSGLSKYEGTWRNGGWEGEFSIMFEHPSDSMLARPSKAPRHHY